MRRLFLLFLLCASLQAMAQPVRGLIIKLKPGAAGSSRLESPQALRERVAGVARDAGVALDRSGPVGSEGHHLMQLPAAQQGQALEATMRRLRLHPDVQFVEPDVLVPLAAVPNDPSYSQQWHLQSPSAFTAAINATAAWNRTTGTANITVAVLDTGILPHPDLAGRYWPGYDFVSEVDYANDGNGRDPDPSDPGDWVSNADRFSNNALFGFCPISNSSWHGTFIAGLIAAATNNAASTAGINWNAKILPVRVSGKCGATLSDILDAMRWAAGLAVAGVPNNPNPARIINLSFGGDAACTQSYQDVINEVTAAGVLVVVAAGNDGALVKRPADCANVLAVGATGPNGTKTRYSNLGTTIGLMAPGGNSNESGNPANAIFSVSNGGTTSPGVYNVGSKDGTSFSAPMAAGVASLMLALNPALSPAQLIARMRASTRAHAFNPALASCSLTFTSACNCNTSVCGAGLLDADGAVQQALNPAAVIAAVATPLPGATIALDGRGSTALGGASIASYAWSQLSGTSVTLLSAGSAQASAALPGTAGTFVFKLRVTDTAGRIGEDVITVTSVAPGVVTSGSGGGGGGSTGWWWGAGLWLLALLIYRRARLSPPTAA